MRRMISDVMQRQIKALFESAWTDDKGNVEIGKNLTVDGAIRVNDFDDYKDIGGRKLTEFMYSQLSPRNHLIKLKAQHIELHMQGACLYNQKTNDLLEARNKVFGLGLDEIPVSGYLYIDGKLCTPLSIVVYGVVENSSIRYVDDTGTEKTTTLGAFGTVMFTDTLAHSVY